MADYWAFSDDISTLWGPEGEGGLTSAPPAAAATEPIVSEKGAIANGHGNGNGARLTVVDQNTRDDVARLAEALTANQVDVVRRADLDAARAEMEGAFTHQIAAALYELLAASNARFAAAEDHINQRVREAVEAHTDRLESSFQTHHRSAMELSEFLWTEMDAMRQRLNTPLDGLVSFQRELRHEVGRLGDMVAKATDSVDRAGADTQRQADAGVERSEAQAMAASSQMVELITALSTLRDDVASLRQEMAELRRTVDESPRARGRRWNRNR